MCEIEEVKIVIKNKIVKYCLFVTVLSMNKIYAQNEFKLSFNNKDYIEFEKETCSDFFTIEEDEKCLNYIGEKKWMYLNLDIDTIYFVEKNGEIESIKLKINEDKTTILETFNRVYGKYEGRSYFGAKPIGVEKDESYNSFYWKIDDLRIVFYQNTFGANRDINITFYKD